MSADISSNENSKDGEFVIPTAEELESLYLLLEAGNLLELDWQSPGKRLPVNKDKVEKTAVVEPKEAPEPAKNDFDFSDDVAQPQMRVRNLTPKSAKKKTANFSGVMETLKKKNAEGST